MFPIGEPDFARRLNLGGDGNTLSCYSMYRIWLASLSLHCGWEVECENLRIPSTRNWAIISELMTISELFHLMVDFTGRKSVQTSQAKEQFQQNIETIIQNVKERGIFKTRIPEGNAQHYCFHDLQPTDG